MKEKRVVVTGLGTINPLAHSADETWQKLCQGNSGIKKITSFDTEDLASKIAGQVTNFNHKEYFGRKESRKMDMFTKYALYATQHAIEDAQLKNFDEDNMGVITGTGIGGMVTYENQHKRFLERGARRVSPYFIPKMVSNMAAGQIAIRFNARAINFNVTSACASSANAIGESYRAIKYGEADVMIAAGTEASVTAFTVAGFSIMRALSTRNDEPEKASRPFDKNRDGFVLSEGAATLIMENLEHAKTRGAKIYAEVVGYGATCDAYHITMPAQKGKGGARAMSNAIESAGIKPEQVQYVNAHGTSTPLNDKSETDAIKLTFGDHAYDLKINSSKSMLGHSLGAAGALESMIVVQSIKNGKIHPTINLTTPDPECDLDYNPQKTIDLDIKYALTNSFGFGGHNATIAFKKYE